MTVKNFKEALKDNMLMGSSCRECGRVDVPPRPVCPSCRSHRLEWVEMSGKGELVAVTEVSVPLTRFADQCPYSVGIVKLVEGPMVSGLLEERDIDPDIGDRVKAYTMENEGEAILRFKSV
ncbi:MAG: Zn-ribbon domain-containing OB-fold protein [Candidatus Bathyarchaeia archaeon]